STAAFRARSSRCLRSEPSPHLHVARRWLAGWHRLSHHGIPRGRNALGALGERAAAPRRGAQTRRRNRRRAGQGPPARNHPPRSEAGQYHADEIGSKAARLWPGESGGSADDRSDAHGCGDTHHAWNLNGRELFYRSGDKMMAVDIATQPSFTVGQPRALFEGQYELSPATSPNYSVS